MTDTVIQRIIQLAARTATRLCCVAKARSLSLVAILPIAAMIGASGPATEASAVPLISEVYYDAVGTDNGQVFVEIYGEPGTFADGLFLEGVNGSNGAFGPTVALFGVFGPDGVFVVADDAGDGTSAVSGADQIANFDFQNGPDSIVLRDADEVFDAVGYGNFGLDDVFAGEGSPAPDPASGSSLARVFADVDTDDNFMDFAIQEIPSPGSVELLPVPEPQPIALLTLGLLALAKRHRVASSGARPMDEPRGQA